MRRVRRELVFEDQVSLRQGLVRIAVVISIVAGNIADIVWIDLRSVGPQSFFERRDRRQRFVINLDKIQRFLGRDLVDRCHRSDLLADIMGHALAYGWLVLIDEDVG